MTNRNHDTKQERNMKLESKYYKHYLLTFALLSLAVQVCFAQIEFTEHNIANEFTGAWSVYTADIDSECQPLQIFQ
jgi:hypothetical protein